MLILDEPTAVLTPQEAHELFGIMRSLKADGKSIIFISHKLNEVLEIADRITVLRRGKKIETVPREGATEASLARAMVGREVLLAGREDARAAGRRPARGRGAPRPRRPRHREGARASRSRCAQARSSASPASTATARPSSSRRSPACEARGGRDRGRRPRAPPGDGAADARRRRRPHPRGPAAARARARVLDRREHRAARLREAARRALGLAVPGAARRRARRG